MKRRILVLTLVLALLVGLVPVVAQATDGPSPEDIKESIDEGVAWLLEQQNLDGSWGDWEQVAVTAFAVKKLEHYAVDLKYGLGLHSPFDATYAEELQAGLNFLFGNASTMLIGVQPHGDPDSDGDGIGVYFGPGHQTYNTGIVLMAIAESTTPDRVVDVPASAVHGWTYEEVARDTVDYLCFGQNDSDWPRGGWGYEENQGWSCNSNTGYAVLGLQYAAAAPPEGFALTIPAFVKTELEIWINYIQSPDGGSGYADPGWSNILRTGNLLKELAFVGADEEDPRVKDALAYLHEQWDDESTDPGWRGWPGGVANYQAMYTTMKGLTSLGIHEFCDPAIDWQADFEMVLLDQQLVDGSWPRTDWDGGSPPILSTLWALLTLEKVAPRPYIEVPLDIKPQSCPNPLSVKAKGVLPVAILGTEDLDVTQVDPASVLLEGVAPLRWALEDVATPFEPFISKEDCLDCTDEGPDGYMDLTLKFKAEEVAAALGEVDDGDCLVLEVTGNLKEEFRGIAIVGEDVVEIIMK